MQLAKTYILDLDGTLMPSEQVDNRCYWRAVCEVFDIPAGAPSLDGFEHVTDVGILEQWCRDTLGRPPVAQEGIEVRDRFLALIRDAANERLHDFTPFPGLRSWLQRQRDLGHGLAIATGGWGHTARFKLTVAGLGGENLPLASADDAVARPDIMRIALARLGKTKRLAHVTYIGDQPWDFRAAAELGWDFIGRGDRTQAAVLRAAGASRVVADFRELQAP